MRAAIDFPCGEAESGAREKVLEKKEEIMYFSIDGGICLRFSLTPF